MWYVEKNYKLTENILTENKKEFLSQKWIGLGQHISYFLHSNTDIVVLTVLTNLRVVAVYSVYNMIVSQIQNFTISFTSGMESVFGDLLARNEKYQIHKSFCTYETIISIDMMRNIGIIALSNGISGSSMGIAAISEIKSVDTSSATSSSPSCLFPIILSEIESRIYMIRVLMTIDDKKTPPFIRLLYKICTIIQKSKKN